MKRNLIMLLSGFMALSLAGCQNNASESSTESTGKSESTSFSESSAADVNSSATVDSNSETAPVSIPQTGFTTAVPEKYKQTAEKQGKVVELQYNSRDYLRNSAPITKTAYVYLPYGYDENDAVTRYIIIYLMHVWGGHAGEYFEYTPTKNMFDNLIEKGEGRMPSSFAQSGGRTPPQPSETGDIPPVIIVSATFYNANSDRDFSSSIAEFREFHRDFEENLMPAVEGQFHTYANSTSAEDLANSRDHRVFGGFSLGSVTTWIEFCYDYIKYFISQGICSCKFTSFSLTLTNS